MKTIQVEVKQQYGQARIFPICPEAKKLCELTGYKTFSKRHLEVINSLGYLVEPIQAVL